MTSEAGLALAVGFARQPPLGMLSVGWNDDADVPFTPVDDFPFEDGAVATLHAARFAADLTVGRLVHLLLECRRVLRPGGVLRVEAARVDPAATRVHEHALLVGLDACAMADDDAALAFTKPDRRVVGTPLVSIGIPAYNPRYFGFALDSALAQTYENIEIVVCDDSDDGAIEATVAQRAGRRPIRYARNPSRLRPRANFTRCLTTSRGEFMKFLCDDDVLAPTCVERLVDAFRQAPDVTLATSHRARIDTAGRELPPLPATWPIVATDALIAGPTLANAVLMAGLNTVGEPSTVLFRRADLLAAPDHFVFRGQAGHGVIDLVTWAALLMKGDAVYLRESLSAFRFHAEQRQHDATVLERSIASIRGLQAAWLELEVHERQSPDQLLVKPFPPDGTDWQPRAVQGFAVRRA